MPQYRIGKPEAPGPGECKTLEIDGHDIALYNVNGVFYATDDFCKHRGGHLGEGHLSGTTVTCPLHFWRYDITNGSCASHPNGDIRAYPIEMKGEELILTADPPFERLF
ncbi:MAG: Rieske 2Fe-2S domain-containing protein [Candidatus Nitronauta litoralis]|uniref:Rieske 2Fe-2S domain-containing protein n=1 Tax=Candidatus Nitronauta litoralis TaxID=2705533 RepID=A0A7T0BWR9_9BACT|nr:MAG: Rieske 2Fe-2S domain-containing protein [Candidatus Nitronauta litoralis]